MMLQHDEIVIHVSPQSAARLSTLPDFSPAKTWIAVHCDRWNVKYHRVCNAVIAKVEQSRWDEDMASQAALKCKDCKSEYTLAEYRYKRVT